MIKSLIGAAIGSRISKTPGKGGMVGAALANVAPFAITRISLPALALMGVGGYLVKRRMDKKKDEREVEEMKQVSGTEKDNPGEAPDAKTGSVVAPPPGNVVNGAGAVDAPLAAT